MGAAQKKSDMDLHTAITKTILDLKRDGTVTALAKELEIPRNRLSLLIGAYEDNTRERQYWDLEPLIKIANKIKVAGRKISVSELIRVAEDVQKGLPPWFHARISENTQPQTRAELVNVFLEAAGCRAYAMKDSLKVRGKRKSFCHYKGIVFSEDAVSVLRSFVDFTIGNGALKKEFVEAYEGGKISSTEAYQMLKRILDSVIGDIHDVDEEAGALALLKRIDEVRGDLTKKIAAEAHRFLEKKNSESAPDKGKNVVDLDS